MKSRKGGSTKDLALFCMTSYLISMNKKYFYRTQPHSRKVACRSQNWRGRAIWGGRAESAKFIGDDWENDYIVNQIFIY